MSARADVDNPTAPTAVRPEDVSVTDAAALYRAQVAVLIALGCVASAVIVALAVQRGDPSDLAAAAVPAAFLLAGGLGGRARPEHLGVRLLMVLGAAHLTAFALTEIAGTMGGPRSVAWMLAAGGDIAYLAGFAALAVVLATYPTGRVAGALQRWFVRGTLAAGVLVGIDQLLLHARLSIASGFGAASLPAPRPLPLVATSVDLLPLALLPVPLAIVVQLMSVRRMGEDDRRAAGWGILGAGLLAAMLLGSPAAAVLAPGSWDVAFPIVVCIVPFLLLGGLLRHRLLRVDVYVVRSLSRGAVILTVLGLAAAADATLGSTVAAGAGAALTVAGVLWGRPVLRLLERITDRFVVGGRVGAGAVAAAMREALAAPDHSGLPERVCRILVSGDDVAWARVVTDVASWSAGVVEGQPEIRIDLVAAGQSVGRLECGPRRGGWRAADRSMLDRVVGPVALAISENRLTRQLADRVEALAASRSRLVQAEDTARRRVERDLHDGVQQQLVALLARIAIAREQVPAGSVVEAALDAAHDLAQQTLRDLRELVAGIRPALLGDRGLLAAVEARAALLPITVAIDADPRMASERFAPEIEGAAYFVISEALANVMKHAGSDRARVVLAFPPEGLRVAVIDEGNGGADERGGGVSGLRDRVEALGGRFDLQSTPDVGTAVIAEFTVETLAVVDA